MPFLTLRECGDSECGTAEGMDATWSKIGSMMIDCDEHKKPCKHTIREANVSIVVCGWSPTKWVCWAFSNTHSDPTSRDEDIGDAADFIQEDYVATDGNGPADGRVMDLNEPLWCARQYWLRAIDIRMRIVHKEWLWLVQSTEDDINTWVSLLYTAR